ncbi:MAG: bifunctional diguanylate cyclase/phosphodiesterase [Nitriliruptoraceae bacterium]
MVKFLRDSITVAWAAQVFGDVLQERHRDEATLDGQQVLLLDIDGFHRINLAFGYTAADEVLVHVAKRLVAAVPTGGIVCRLSVDEFGVVLPPSSTPIAATAKALSDAMFAPGAPHVGNVSVSIGTAVGIEGHDPVELLRRAGAALYVARQKPGRIVDAAALHHVFGVAEQEELAVRTALRLGEHVLHYLPVMQLDNMQPIGVEMLVTWQQQDLSLRWPATFLPIVQRSGLAAEFGTHMFARACVEWATGLRACFGPVDDDVAILAVNVCAEQSQQEGFADVLAHILARSGLMTREVIVEITERAFESPQSIQQLQSLRATGVRIALDDFGRGSVMLAQLKTLPIDWIKVDQELIRSLNEDDPDLSLIDDIGKLSRFLGIGVLVENIRTQILLERLRIVGINIGQGMLFGPPDTAANLQRALMAVGPA